jgi:hypothetical protein
VGDRETHHEAVTVAEIQKADPHAVRIVVAVIASATLLGVVLINATEELHPEVQAWIRQDVRVRVPMALAVVTLITVGPVVGVAAYLWRFGQRMIRTRRYPPEGFRMVRDTQVVTGDAAIRQGRLVLGLATIIGVTSVVLAFFLLRLALLL